ncbi:Dimodular nonribosomal peptide synthase [Photorhabdus australis subsp. thailandensis]|uniref:Dimodular nonribosomal peptide synthase n=1 Tax=Photorhabdus australis subsp. thailandensis TaxID=2805096 RepID=A0A1C0U9X5_9GAMM|nr:condensation domain-containing protein [Photorhabdus australis]OCQ54712.1 Dimodular nonribosomal peptide synthase [Photorhabdus australis subsp. thailandensis]
MTDICSPALAGRSGNMAREFKRLLTDDEALLLNEVFHTHADNHSPSEVWETEKDLTEFEEMMWLHHQQDSDTSGQFAYAWSLTGNINIGRLIRVLELLTKDMVGVNVRYRFDDEGDLRKYCDTTTNSSIDIYQIQSDEEAINSLLKEQCKPIGLDEYPPIKFMLFMNGKRGVILGVIVHHILRDTVSLSQMLIMLSDAYNNDLKTIGFGKEDLFRKRLSAKWLSCESGKIGIPWFYKSDTTRNALIKETGKISYLDDSIHDRLVSRYRTTIDVDVFASFLPAEKTAYSALATVVALFGCYIAVIGSHLDVNVSVSCDPEYTHDELNSQFFYSALMSLCVCQDDRSFDKIIADIEKQIESGNSQAGNEVEYGRDNPHILVTWLNESQLSLRLNDVIVELLPIPPLNAHFDISLAAGNVNEEQWFFELITGPSVSAHIGAFLLEGFCTFIYEQNVAIAPKLTSIFSLPTKKKHENIGDTSLTIAKQQKEHEVTDRSDNYRKVANIILNEFRQALSSPEMTVSDDFFDHGGHSLIGTRVIGRLLSLHNIEIHINHLFSYPTALKLAEYAQCHDPIDENKNELSEEQSGEDISVVAPLSLAQKSLWKAYAAFDFNDIFNLPFILKFSADIDELIFQQAFFDVLQRHSVLRSLFYEKDGEAYQCVVPMKDLSNYQWFWDSREYGPLSSEEILKKEGKYQFDISKELPLRIKFVTDKDSGQQFLSMLFHHVVLDEWSVVVLMKELKHAYKYRLINETPEWQEQPLPFYQYAIRQNDEGMNQSHLDYWVNNLRGAPSGEPIFKNAARELSGKANSCEGLEFEIEKVVAQGLQSLARRNGASFFNVLYASIVASLNLLGATDDLLVGTSASGRDDVSFFDTIGYFTTLVIHRVRFTEQMTFTDLITQVKSNINDSLPYTDIPIDLIEEALSGHADQGKDHLFEVYIQLHAKSSLSGEFHMLDGSHIAFQQVVLEKQESLLGLHFEIVEEMIAGEEIVRILFNYRSDRYSAAQIAQISETINGILVLFAKTQDSDIPLRAILPRLSTRIYPIDFKMDRDGKGANPREHR